MTGLLIVPLLSAGCGTIVSLSNLENEGTRYGYMYSGVRLDSRAAFGDDYLQHFPLAKLFFLIDFPLSIVADTLAAPVTLPIELHQRDMVDERLIGTWQGDHNATVSNYVWWREERLVQDYSVQENSRPTITFSEHALSVQLGGVERVFSYRVVERLADNVTIVGGPPLSNDRPAISTIRFGDDGLYYACPGWSGGEEHFRKQCPPPQ